MTLQQLPPFSRSSSGIPLSMASSHGSWRAVPTSGRSLRALSPSHLHGQRSHDFSQVTYGTLCWCCPLTVEVGTWRWTALQYLYMCDYTNRSLCLIPRSANFRLASGGFSPAASGQPASDQPTKGGGKEDLSSSSGGSRPTDHSPCRLFVLKIAPNNPQTKFEQ
jgi:hypothetical protein